MTIRKKDLSQLRGVDPVQLELHWDTLTTGLRETNLVS